MYQSDESDDASSYNATSSDESDEDYDYDRDELEEEERIVKSTYARVKEHKEPDIHDPWFPSTRRKAPVNYTEEKITPAQPPSQVCMTASCTPAHAYLNRKPSSNLCTATFWWV
jgi:hypothetical protein